MTLSLGLGVLGWAYASDGPDFNRVANGDFETGFLSLSLPAVSYFPLVVNGWGARGITPEVLAGQGNAHEGSFALRLASRPRATSHLLQDLPLATTSYRLELSFLVERGSQEIALLTDWNRGEPSEGGRALRLLLTPAGIEITTPSGSWDLLASLDSGDWHRLVIVADARPGTHTVFLDDRLVMSLPGLSRVPPRTLILGEAGTGSASSYLYDDIRLAQLAELELAGLRAEVMAFASPSLGGLNARLEAAAATLSRGSPRLALPELNAARRLLANTRGDARRSASADMEGTERMLGALDALIELLES